MQTLQNIPVKKYVLLDSMHPTAPIFAQVSPTERVRLNRLKNWSPYIKVTFTNEIGKSRTARLKLNSDSIWQDEQIKEFSIPANEKFTTAERMCVRFTNGVLVTGIPVVQEFLESSPQFDGFNGISPEGLKPCYKLDDTKEKIKEANIDFKNKLRAGSIIAKSTLQECQVLLRLIQGSASDVPDDIDEAQLALVDLIEQSDEALGKILTYGEEGLTEDDDVEILIGKLLDAKKIDFNVVEGFVCKRRDDVWIPVKQISNEYAYEARVNFFKEFLSSEKGALLRDDLEEMLIDDVMQKEKTPPSQTTSDTTEDTGNANDDISGKVGSDEFGELNADTDSGIEKSTIYGNQEVINQPPQQTVAAKQNQKPQTSKPQASNNKQNGKSNAKNKGR